VGKLRGFLEYDRAEAPERAPRAAVAVRRAALERQPAPLLVEDRLQLEGGSGRQLPGLRLPRETELEQVVQHRSRTRGRSAVAIPGVRRDQPPQRRRVRGSPPNRGRT